MIKNIPCKLNFRGNAKMIDISNIFSFLKKITFIKINIRRFMTNVSSNKPNFEQLEVRTSMRNLLNSF